MYLGIDFGQKRIGLAISDQDGRIASPYQTLIRKSDKQVISEIKEVVDHLKISKIILGLPTNSQSSKRIKSFAQKLEKELQIPLNFYDESLTTRQAENMIRYQGNKISRKKQKSGVKDRIAAALILQSYLNEQP